MKVRVEAACAVLLAILAPGWAAEGPMKQPPVVEATATTSKIHGMVHEDYLAKGGAIVYLEYVPGTFEPMHAVMDQEVLTFTPHILPVLVGSTVTFKNSDPFAHNVLTPDGEKYNLGVFGKGEARSYTFTRPGFYTQLCSLHPMMEAFVVVLQNPFFELLPADGDGVFTFQDVPAGRYKLRVWAENRGEKELPAAVPVTVSPGRSQWVSLTPPSTVRAGRR